jgi:hypothetical protein
MIIISFLFDRIYWIYWIIISKFPDETLKPNLPVAEKFFFDACDLVPQQRRFEFI